MMYTWMLRIAAADYGFAMRKKLLLINPVNPSRTGLTVNPSSRFQPLGLGVIAALTPVHWDIEIIDENFEPFQYTPADLVGLTAFTASACRAYEIAAQYGEHGIPTVLGGIHASMLPDEALDYVDTVVIGEAESIWPSIINDFEHNEMQRLYRGVWKDLKDLPAPRRDLFHKGYLFGSIQTSRGCPMDCEFCSVTAFNGNHFRQRPVEDVLDELETIPQRLVFFVDDNLVGYGRKAAERTIALCKGMLKRKIKKSWFCQASMNFAENEEVLVYAAQSGCRMVFLGVEAEDSHALAEVNKSLNMRMTKHDYEKVFQRIHKHGIAVLGAFIYGMDTDTVHSLEKRTSYILKSGIDVMQATFLTPLPGTRLFEKLNEDDRVLYTHYPEDWQRYDMTEVVFEPRMMTSQELASSMRKSVRRMYSKISIMRKFIKTWWRTRNLTAALWAYNSNMNYRSVASAGNSLSK
jgi:radical SAM superfamily enzyme YgiQ (UPF0313 family)